MKKLKAIAAIAIVSMVFTSCATVLGGPITSYQVVKPAPGEPQREIRVVALIADIVFFPPLLIVDFATGAIYRPAPTR